jgi:hypothetical protein
MVEPRSDNKISVLNPDFGLEQTWDLDSLPFEQVKGLEYKPELSQELLKKLADEFIAPNESKAARYAALTFLYLYICLSRPGQRCVS